MAMSESKEQLVIALERLRWLGKPEDQIAGISARQLFLVLKWAVDAIDSYETLEHNLKNMLNETNRMPTIRPTADDKPITKAFLK